MEEGKKAGALLDVRGLRKYFELGGGQRVHAVERVSFSGEWKDAGDCRGVRLWKIHSRTHYHKDL